jgi:sugar transferase (PEP-CTERM system associated)
MSFATLLLFLGDFACAIIALCTGHLVRFDTLPDPYEFLVSDGLRLLIFIGIVSFVSYLMELYDTQKKLRKREIFVRSVVGAAASFFLLSSLLYIMPFVDFGRGWLLLSLVNFVFFQFLWHVIHKYIRELSMERRVLVIGTGPLAKLIGGLIVTTNHTHTLAGYFGCCRESVDVPDECIIGSGEEGIAEAARRENAEKIVISLTERRGGFPLSDLMHCKFSGIEVTDAPSFYEQVTGKLLLESITPGWFIFSNGFKVTRPARAFKRIFDKILSCLCLLVTLPLFPIIALAIKITSPGPVLFRQVRTGMHEKEFVLYKFRTMRTDAETGTGAVWAQKDDPRVTSFGKFLRKSRLDELPQLFNVLKGDMSFIGPRPERPEFVEKLKKQIPYYSHRHFVKPGITGWAQIKYPYGASVEDALEKLRYDLFYIKNLSITLDLLIFFETIKVILYSRGGR